MPVTVGASTNVKQEEKKSQHYSSINENNMKVSISLKREPSPAAATNNVDNEILSNQANVGFTKRQFKPELHSSPGRETTIAPPAQIQNSKVTISLKGSES